MLSFEEALQRFYFQLSAAATRFGLFGAPPPPTPVTHWDPNYSCRLMDSFQGLDHE